MSSPAGKPETRAAIVEAAFALFEQRAYHDVGMGEIAAAAGVSRQALYLHFEGKADLLMAVLDLANGSAQVGERLRAVSGAATGEEALERFVEINAATVPGLMPFIARLDTARRSDPDVERAWRTQADDRRRWCRRIVKRLADEGRLAEGWSLDAAADLLWAVTMPGPWEDLSEIGWTPRRYRTQLTDLLRRALVGGYDERPHARDT